MNSDPFINKYGNRYFLSGVQPGDLNYFHELRKTEVERDDEQSETDFSMSNNWKYRSGLQVALIEPEIPPNTGNIARLCGATFTPLHLVGKLGFRVDEKAVRRAGLDYWDDVEISYPRNLESLFENLPDSRFLYFSTKAERVYTDFSYRPGDCLVFGRETRGLPEDLLRNNSDRCLRVPMPNPSVRSLNLATCVGIVLYEALRQIGFWGAPE